MKRTISPETAKKSSKKLKDNKNTNQAVSTIVRSKKRKTPLQSHLLPTGVTLLNCAFADNAQAGMSSGKIINIVGGSGVGKTLISETLLAQIANDPKYKHYDLYLDDAEHALEMDIEGMFGATAAKRINPPLTTKDGSPIYSETVEQFFASLLSLIKKGEPFVYVLDSLDALTTSDEVDLVDDLAKQHVKAGDDYDARDKISLGGTYGMAKAKMMAQLLRVVDSELKHLDACVIIISQVRAKINAMPGQKTKTRSGGEALEFYCTHVVWLNLVKTIKDTKYKEILGAEVQAEVTKNKVTGKKRKVTFSIYYDYGIDDITANIDFLLENKFLKQKGAYIDASILDIDKNVHKTELISIIEEEQKEDEVVALVQKAWDKREDALSLKRPPRFRK